MNFLTPYKLYAYAGLVIIIAVILSFHLFADNQLRKERDTAIKERDSAVTELKDFKIAIALQTRAREVEIANKRLAGNAQTQLLQAEHEAALKQRDLDRVKSTKAIKDFYEKRLNINNFNASERLRINAERSRFGLPEIIQATEGATEGGGECHSTIAYENLERACAITTLDFNLARQVIDADTAMAGRDE